MKDKVDERLIIVDNIKNYDEFELMNKKDLISVIKELNEKYNKAKNELNNKEDIINRMKYLNTRKHMRKLLDLEDVEKAFVDVFKRTMVIDSEYKNEYGQKILHFIAEDMLAEVKYHLIPIEKEYVPIEDIDIIKRIKYMSREELLLFCALLLNYDDIDKQAILLQTYIQEYGPLDDKNKDIFMMVLDEEIEVQ